MPTRLITFGGSTIAVVYNGSQPATIIDFLFRYLPPELNSRRPHITFHLLTDEGSGQLTLRREDTLIYTGDSLARAAELLQSQVCYHLADRSQGGVLLHAAALAWQGWGLILPGATGAGKSTLTAWLLTQGFDYLTDELVFIPTGSETMQAFTRPLNLKRPARPIWRNLVTGSIWPELVLTDLAMDLVLPDLLQPAVKQTSKIIEISEVCWPLRLIVFPRYRPDDEFSLSPLSKAQATKALLEGLVNARNLPEHGLPEAVRLARAIPAYQMSYSDFAQIGLQLERLLSQ
jgi:hypothetical protein